MSIVAEAPGFIQVFSNGTVKRFVPEIASPSSEWSNDTYKYKSKDITIDPSKPISARIFLPDHQASESLRVLVYFHGGGFCIGSTTRLGYHIFLGELSAMSKTIVVSVDYRLAPENRLPIAYEDCYTAIEWIIASKLAGWEPWLERADLYNVFLSGDSAGGNIAHQIAIKAMKSKNLGVKIKGLIPIHPYFGSEERTELELAEGSGDEVAMNDMFWKLSLPEGSDRDFYGCNFEKGDVEMEWSLFPAIFMFVAGMDFLKDRGVMYVEFLKEKGVKTVKLVEDEGESHVFHVWNPRSEATRLLEGKITDFIRSM